MLIRASDWKPKVEIWNTSIVLMQSCPRRFTVLPIQYSGIWQMYKTAVASFCAVEEVVLSKVGSLSVSHSPYYFLSRIISILKCIFIYCLFLFRSTSSRGRLTRPCAGSTPRRPPTSRGSFHLPACGGENWHCGIKLLTYNFRCIIWRLKRTPIYGEHEDQLRWEKGWRKPADWVMSPMITSFLWTWISSRWGKSLITHHNDKSC